MFTEGKDVIVALTEAVESQWSSVAGGTPNHLGIHQQPLARLMVTDLLTIRAFSCRGVHRRPVGSPQYPPQNPLHGQWQAADFIEEIHRLLRDRIPQAWRDQPGEGAFGVPKQLRFSQTCW